MKSKGKKLIAGLLLAASGFSGATGLRAEGNGSANSIPVTITVTANVASNKRMPEILREDVLLQQGKNRLQVQEWIPARGNRAGLELFILIDDAVDPRLAMHYDELREFVQTQPASTLIGIGYMRNGTVQVAQQLTNDHVLVAQALRMPLGSYGAFRSPYLSVIDLMKNWVVDENRREVLMITDGVGRDMNRHGWHRGYRYDGDVDVASQVAQRSGTNIFTIYAPSAHRFRQSYWSGINAQNNMARLSDKTGGASFFLGLQNPVSLQPYLGQLQTMLDNQYILSFSMKPAKRSGLQAINLTTEVAGVDLAANEAVWVAGRN
jgi:hypothetical protein